MLTVKIEWNNKEEIVTSVYSCKNYTVSYPKGENGFLKTTNLYLDGGEHHIIFDAPTVAYVMNGTGATVDVIRGI